jgi:hypothetical protein
MSYSALSLMLEKHFSAISQGNLRPENGLGCKYEIHISCYLCIDEYPLMGQIFALNVHVGLGLSLYMFLIQTSKVNLFLCLIQVSSTIIDMDNRESVIFFLFQVP